MGLYGFLELCHVVPGASRIRGLGFMIQGLFVNVRCLGMMKEPD